MLTVERAEHADAPTGYRIHPHGRYSHTREYVVGVLGEVGFEDVSLRAVELRKEGEAWVTGWLVSARSPGRHA